MREYAFFTNFPTPQKVDLFNRLNHALSGRVVFFFYAQSVPKRKGWERSLNGADFRYEIMGARRFRTSIGPASDEAYTFLPVSFPSLRPFRKVVISGGLTPTELALALKSLGEGIPYVLWSGAPSLTFGGWWGVPYRIPIRFFLFSNAETVVAATSLAKAHARSLGARRVVVAYTTFDTSRFMYDKTHRGRCLSLLFVGRLIKVKRVEDLLRALKYLPGATLDIVGDGPLRTHLKALGSDLGLMGRLKFVGALPYSRMPGVYRRYDLLVLPSRWEVFGFVVLEAAMSSVPAVVSEGVGARDFLPGYAVFPPGNVRAMVRAIERMRDPGVRNRTVEYVRRKVLDLATPDRWARTFANVLEE